MEKSYQLLPLVGMDQAPNQLADVEIMWTMVVEAPAVVLGDGKTTVDWMIGWTVVDAAPVGETLKTTVCRLVGRTICRLVGHTLGYRVGATLVGQCSHWQ